MRDLIIGILRWIKHRSYTLIYRSFSLFPIKKNKVFIVNFHGKGYGDNAKYIAKVLCESGEDYEIFWSLKDLGEALPDGIKKVRYRSLAAIYHEVTARIWIDNCRKLLWVRKRRGQYYIQCWHGDIAFKKIEKDAENSLPASYIEDAKNDSRMADLFISGNEWFSNKIHDAFWYDGEIAKCGYPRRDILYSTDMSLKAEIKRRIGIDSDKKLLLYAPTFRKEQSSPDLSVYQLDWEKVLCAMAKRFGGEWIGAIRLHPNIASFSDKLGLPRSVADVTSYPDMQELLFAADACISDYSSSVLDFAVTEKPGFVFATDYEEYKKDRDCYFTFEELPFPIARSNCELVERILSFDRELYLEEHSRFYRDRIKKYPEGQASERIAELIREKCFEK